MSVLLAGLVLALCLLCAWGILHFGRKYGEPEGKVRTLAGLFTVGGLVAAFFVYRVDDELRRTTLFEVVLVGTQEAADVDGTPVQHLAFEVEHPDVEHEVLVAPEPQAAHDAAVPVALRVRLLAPDGAPLLDEEHTFGIRVEGSASGSGRHDVRRRLWDTRTWRVTPTGRGRHVLELWHVSAGIPRIHVRVGDPLKTDGVRAPGF